MFRWLLKEGPNVLLSIVGTLLAVACIGGIVVGIEAITVAVFP
jgi:hypothetical protein